MILTASQLLEELREMGVRELRPPRDPQYFCPSLSPWLDEFGAWWKKTILPGLTYKEHKFDCDNFAELARVEATKALQRAVTIDNCDHTFFYAEIYLGITENVFKIDSGNHDTNFVRCAEGWRWFNAYTGQNVDLKASIADESIAILHHVRV